MVDQDVVTSEITEEHERKEEDPRTRYFRSERSSSFQSRSVRLPQNAKMDELKADVDKGVLHVSFVFLFFFFLFFPLAEREKERSRGKKKDQI